MNDDDHEPRPDSLLPYEQWTEQALRQVVVRALSDAAANGLPGDHHFYITFRTDHPGVSIPNRLRTQYPQEMTIVLQHQFWDLQVDEAACVFGVALSFGGVPATLRIPLDALVAFADPAVRYGLRFTPNMESADLALENVSLEDETEQTTPENEKPVEPQVVSLDAFRRRTPPGKE
jgi:hypothetical protein